jgi:sugar phosphate isomerase/epimerase
MYKLTGFADEAANSIQGQVEALKRLGWNALELRAVDSILAHDLSEDAFSFVADYLDQENVSVPCLGSGIANWARPVTEPFDKTKETVKRAIKRMKRLNTPLVRIMSYKVLHDEDGRISRDQLLKERFDRLNWICQSFLDQGITPVHENCHTYGGLSAEHTFEMLEAVKGMKLVFDTGNPPITIDGRSEFPYAAQNSYEFFSAVKDHIEHVHIKDAKWDSNRKELYFFPGEGAGDVRKIVAELKRDGYSGYYSIEPHMEVVFHNTDVDSNDERRMQNFVSYGKRFEKILAEV